MNRATPILAAAALAAATPLAPAQDGWEFLQVATETEITVDGDVSEWPRGVYAAATPRHVFFRFRTPRLTTLTASPEPIRLVLDVDGSNDSGAPTLNMGADLEIIFADPERRENRGPALTIRRLAPEGPLDVTAAQAGLLAAPTHASEWFELRLDRAAAIYPGALSVPDAIPKLRMYVGNAGPVEPPQGVIAAVASSKAVPPAPVAAALPAKAEDALRVLSWNVLWREPMKSPAAFARVIAALRPDVILFQEWAQDEMSEEAVLDWLNLHAAQAGGSWSVEASTGWGVAVASIHPIGLRGPDALLAESPRWDYPVRLAAAEVRSPLGTIIFGSVHTKCCGSLDTDEDTRRAAEALAINNTLASVAEQARTDLIIVGGDFNLVGRPAVLVSATEGLDADGSALRPALPRVLGDRSAVYTFGRRDGYVPSRLDYINYPDAALRVTAAFVLDTTLLDDASLAAAGLAREDSLASDHLPVIVDLAPVD